MVSGQSVSFLNKRDIFGSGFEASDWLGVLSEVILLAEMAIPSKAVEDLMKCAEGLIMKPTISASSSQSQHTFLGFKHSSVMAKLDTWDQNPIE